MNKIIGLLRTLPFVALFSIASVQSCLAWPALLAGEDFETASGTTPPFGWAFEQVAGTMPGISFVTSASNPIITAAYSGMRFASYNSFDITTGSTRLRQSVSKSTLNRAYVMVDFAWYEDPGNPAAMDKVEVQWSTDGTNWNTAATFYRFNSVEGWKTKNVLLPVGANNQPTLYIAFLFTSGNGGNCALDKIVETVGPPVSPGFATIGAGTFSSNYPYTTNWMGGRTQMLYTAAELTNAGIAAGNLTSVGFNVISNSSQVMNGFNVKLGATALTTLSGGYVNGLTAYYTTPYSVPGTGWRTINLSTPFNWNGTSNVIVEICYANTSYTTYSPVYATTMTGKVAGHYADLQTECSTSANNVPTLRPNIQFGTPSLLLGVLRGYVRNAVTLAPVPFAIVINGSQHDTCDFDGSYVLYNIPAGTVIANATSTGYLSGSTSAIITAGSITNQDIFLNNCPVVSGVVTDASTGAPLIGAKVTIGTGLNAVSTLTLAGGNFTTPMLYISGVQQIQVTKTGYDDWNGTITLVPNSIITQNASMLPTAVQPGTFTATFDNPANPEAVNLSWLPPLGNYELIYDDGSEESLAIWPVENNLHAVRFTPVAWPAKITGGSLNLGPYYYYGSTAFSLLPFKIIVYKADGPGGLPGSILDSIVVTATSYEWTSFTFPTPVTLNSGDFYLAMKQVGVSPLAAGIAVDTTVSQMRSYAMDISSGGSWTPVTGIFMLRAIVQGAGGPLLGDNSGLGDQPLSPSYQVWRLMQGQEGSMIYWISMWTGMGTTAIDHSWPILPTGAWRWAVKAVYSPPGTRYSAPAFSNVLGKNWTANVDVCVSLSCSITPNEGTIVKLMNSSYPDTVYNGITDNSGCVHFSNVWKGNYIVTVMRFLYPVYSQNVTISANASFDVAMVISATPPYSLTMNNVNLLAAWDTPWAPRYTLNESWDSGSFTTNQWTVSGGSNWEISPGVGNPAPCANFKGSPTLSNYDEYLTSKSLAGLHAPVVTLSYDMSLDNYATTNLNTLAVELWNGTTWNVIKTYNNQNGSIPWTSESVNISTITHSSAYKIRFHASGVNSIDINYWFVDNVRILNSDGIGGGNPCLTGYNVYLDNVLIGSTPDTSYAIPPGMVTYGQPYNLCVAAVYDALISTQICTAFTSGYLYPPLNLTGAFTAGTTTLNWNPPAVPAGLTGYNIYRNNILVNPAPVTDLSYSDTPVPYGLNLYTVRAVYGANISLNAGPVVINAVPMLHSVNDVTLSNGMTGCYNATQTITVAGGGTTYSVETGGSATMIAGQNIQYFPGTTVSEGGYMWGYIAPAGPFCTNPTLPVFMAADEIPAPGADGFSFTIYPNPARESVTLRLNGADPENQAFISVYNIMGNRVISRIMEGERHCTLSLSEYPAGVYFIRVISGKNVATSKIVRQ